MTQGFKVGDKVKCINPGPNRLTLGKFYEVKGVYDDGTIKVFNDDCSLIYTYMNRFEFAEPAFDPTTNEKAWHFLTEEERKVFKEWGHGLERLSTFGNWVNFYLSMSPVYSDTILRAKPAPKVKEMTVAEIEEALGYQVKVVK